MINLNNPEQILKRNWGYDNFRPMQKEIVQSVLDGHDTLALLATGGGKSITYQVPALMMDGLCLVISPLIALMQDQLKGLKDKGIKALSLNSSMSKKAIDTALDNCIYGNYKFLFVSPERLNNPLFIERLKKFELCFVAVDEAHCISQWGHDFRPDYLNIASIRELHSCPILALTATATSHVINDIQNHLEFKDPLIFKGGFERINLAFNVNQSFDKMKDILSLLETNKDEVSIVYTRSRADTVKIASYLNEHGLAAEYYHAGLSQEMRKDVQSAWMKEDFKVMVATNAFGMGIDKPNVRQVIHYTLCDNPEAYFQEAGRAGRDQLEAKVQLLYNEDDLVTARYRFVQSHPDPDFIKTTYHQLCMNYQLAIGSGQDETFQFDLRIFCKKYKLPMMMTHASLKSLEMNQQIEMNESYHQPSKLQILVERYTVEDFIKNQPKLGNLLSVILRSYTHLFTQEVTIKETELARRTSLSYFDIKSQLNSMIKMGILQYKPSHDQAMITFLNPRVSENHLMLDIKSLKSRKARAENKLNAMINYVQNENICRSLILLHYFGENPSGNCGKCDNCKNNNSINFSKLQLFKNEVLSETETKSIELETILNTNYGLNQTEIKSALRWLIDEGALRLKNGQLQSMVNSQLFSN